MIIRALPSRNIFTKPHRQNKKPEASSVNSQNIPIVMNRRRDFFGIFSSFKETVVDEAARGDSSRLGIPLNSGGHSDSFQAPIPF